MYRFLSWLIIIVVFISSGDTVDYCKIQCGAECEGECNKSNHTMCLYPEPGLSASCVEATSHGLTDDQKKELLRVHNEYRAKVASGNEDRGAPGPQPAGIIPPLEWDDEIAAIAQRWVDQCMFSHDSCRDAADDYVGQNLAMNFYMTEMESMVNMWTDEVTLFPGSNVKNFKYDDKFGHYTQVVWGETTKLGCGLSEFFDQAWDHKIVVLACNYKPGGNANWENVNVYETS